MNFFKGPCRIEPLLEVYVRKYSGSEVTKDKLMD